MAPGPLSFLKEHPRKADFVFTNRWNGPISRDQIDDILVSLQKKYPSMEPWRSHDLRHSFAFNFFKQGGQMYPLKAILGHQNITLTGVDLYGNCTAEYVKRVSPYV
jgi:site-specific recombinase XerD